MAKLLIKIVVTSLKRQSTTFRQTTSTNELWVVSTDLNNYMTDIEPTLAVVNTYAKAERQRGCEVSCHYAVNMENTTADAPAKGVITSAKAHLDGALSTGQWDDIDVLRTKLLNTVSSIRTTANY